MDDFAVVNSIPEICARHGVKNAIISPGSRNAPLTISFSNHPDIKCWSISDERSAAFVAMGMCQQTKAPTVLICTSGSAALNYAPGVSEAFFQNVPLIVLTADRPAEWVDQWDGQTVHQKNIFGTHVKFYAELPTQPKHDDEVWHYQRLVNEALLAAKSGSNGPVHLNIPFREPFYPKPDELNQSIPIKVINRPKAKSALERDELEALINAWNDIEKKIILVGQQPLSPDMVEVLIRLTNEKEIPVLGDIISNIQGVENGILHSDLILGNSMNEERDDLLPELVVSFGKSLISKDLKLFLRGNPGLNHWHVANESVLKDPFQSLTNSIQHDPIDFLKVLLEITSTASKTYHRAWQMAEDTACNYLRTIQSLEWSELKALSYVMNRLENPYNLHLANSMAVRYANFIGTVSGNNNIEVYANRGTSGIDGSTSTAVGTALSSKCQNILITGDLAFFYDRNAFWHNYELPNLKVVLLNNNGGGIFRMIEGPTRFDQFYKTYFETDQQLNAHHLCNEFGFSYFPVNNEEELQNQLDNFLSAKNTSILEITTDPEKNTSIYKSFKYNFKLN